MEQNETQITLSLQDLWYILTSHFLAILITAVLSFLFVLGYSVFTYEPVYTSTATIYILRQNNESSSDGSPTISNSDFSLALSTVNDCTVLLTSHMVLDDVIEELGMPISYETLKSMISIQNPTSTRILQVSVTAPSPMDAKIIVDELCKIGAESIMNTLGINQVNLIDYGTYSENPSNNMITPYSIVIMLLAVIAVYGIFVMVFILDDKIKTPDDIEKHLGLTVLGLIPNIGEEVTGRDTTKYGKYGRYGRYGRYGKYSEK